VEDKYEGYVNFVFLDIDDSRNDEFKNALGFRYQPHLFLLDADGNVVQQWVGFVEGEVLEQAIVQYWTP
jgi:hypothetical protein